MVGVHRIIFKYPEIPARWLGVSPARWSRIGFLGKIGLFGESSNEHPTLAIDCSICLPFVHASSRDRG